MNAPFTPPDVEPYYGLDILPRNAKANSFGAAVVVGLLILATGLVGGVALNHFWGL